MLPASDRAPYKMDPIPPHRAKAIFQEYLDRRAAEKKTRLEMAQKIMTWYSDLESEVSEHFDKALQQSAKRPRLEDSATSVPDTSADSNDRSWTSSSPTMDRHSQPPSLSRPAPLPSLFPPPPADLPTPTMIYPDYYNYTDEVDPLVTDDDYSPDPTSHEDDSALLHYPLDISPTSHAAITCYNAQLDYESQFFDHPPLTAACDLVCDSQFYDHSLPAMFAEEYPVCPITTTAAHCDLPQQTLAFDYTLHTSPATTSDGSHDGDDDIENIRLDWTEEERTELQTIMV